MRTWDSVYVNIDVGALLITCWSLSLWCQEWDMANELNTGIEQSCGRDEAGG